MDPCGSFWFASRSFTGGAQGDAPLAAAPLPCARARLARRVPLDARVVRRQRAGGRLRGCLGQRLVGHRRGRRRGRRPGGGRRREPLVPLAAGGGALLDLGGADLLAQLRLGGLHRSRRRPERLRLRPDRRRQRRERHPLPGQHPDDPPGDRHPRGPARQLQRAGRRLGERQRGLRGLHAGRLRHLRDGDRKRPFRRLGHPLGGPGRAGGHHPPRRPGLRLRTTASGLAFGKDIAGCELAPRRCPAWGDLVSDGPWDDPGDGGSTGDGTGDAGSSDGGSELEEMVGMVLGGCGSCSTGASGGGAGLLLLGLAGLLRRRRPLPPR